MDWINGYGNLFGLGLLFMTMSIAQWAWAAYRDGTTSGAKGTFAGAVLILAVGGVWTIRDRKRAQ
jgi:hypothetical protein